MRPKQLPPDLRSAIIAGRKAELAALKGNKHLTLHGGQGQAGVGLIGDSVMTVQETVATTIAKDVIDDAERHHKKKVDQLSLAQIAPFAQGRDQGRACEAKDILAEIARIQNHAIYKDRLRRR